MNSDRITRAVRRMAMQVVEDSKKGQKIALVGLNKRGFNLATALAKELETLAKIKSTCHAFDIDHIDPESYSFDPKVYQADYVLLVDDVLFSGTTMMKAIMQLLNRIDPNTLRTAVLIDRGHRRYPIYADFVGLESPTKLREHVEVQFTKHGKPLAVELTHQ